MVERNFENPQSVSWKPPLNNSIGNHATARPKMPVEVKYMYPSVRVESHMNSVPTNKTYNYDDKNPTFIGNGVANAFSGYHASNTNVTNKPRASRDQV